THNLTRCLEEISTTAVSFCSAESETCLAFSEKPWPVSLSGDTIFPYLSVILTVFCRGAASSQYLTCSPLITRLTSLRFPPFKESRTVLRYWVLSQFLIESLSSSFSRLKARFSKDPFEFKKLLFIDTH